LQINEEGVYMKKIWDVIVIGGGQAGLAAGYYLQRKGLDYLILEANEHAAGSWPHYYDSLKLFSSARYSSLPGKKFPGDPDHYPLKAEVIDYLVEYKNHFNLTVMVNQMVLSIKSKAKVFEILTESGETFHAQTIINATGSFNKPNIPLIKGQESFLGRTIHSSEYRNPEPFINQRVIVAGSRNSAVQIAIELAESGKTTLAVRKPVQLIRQRFLGKDLHFWIRTAGIDTFPFWRFGKEPPSSNAVVNLDHYEERLEAGKPDQKPMFSSFYENGVIWPDGTKEQVDTVIYATGYHYNLDYLSDLGAINQEGKPMQIAGVSTSVPGLYYIGLEGQRSFSSATLRGVGPDAQFIVQKIRRYLKSTKF
jgi:putative flavoprotein involved in K+ transport